MFRITCICDDRAVPDILRFLASCRAHNVECVPVVNPLDVLDGAKPNGSKKPAKVKLKTHKLSHSVEAVYQKLEEAGLEQVTPGQMKDIVTGMGLAATTAPYVQSKLMKAKLLEWNGHGTTLSAYKVL